MKLTKGNLKKAIEENFPDLRMDTFIFEKVKAGVYKAQSKFEGVNADMFTFDNSWEETLVKHIKWQLNL